MIPQQGGDIVVTFTADGHTWKVDVPACPDIGVRGTARSCPRSRSAPAFLNDLKTYAGHLPQAGPPRGRRRHPADPATDAAADCRDR